jgi:hypothetical protein
MDHAHLTVLSSLQQNQAVLQEIKKVSMLVSEVLTLMKKFPTFLNIKISMVRAHSSFIPMQMDRGAPCF